MELILNKIQEELYDKFINDSSSCISENIKNNIKKIEQGLIEEDYLKEICKCIDFVNKKTNNSNFNNKQKQIMSEIIFSNFEYLNSHYSSEFKYSNIDNFLAYLDKNIKYISYNDSLYKKIKLWGANGKFSSNKIILNENLKDYDKKFILIFSHELLHSITEKEDLLYIKDEKKASFKHLTDNEEYFLLMECQNEETTLNILKENFGYIIGEFDFINILEDNEVSDKLLTKQKGFVYNEILCFKNVLDFIFEDKLEFTQVTSKCNISDLIKDLNLNGIDDELKKFLNLNVNLMNNKEYTERKINKDKYFKHYDAFENLVFKYIETKDLTLVEFFKLRDSFKNSSLILLEENKNLIQETLKKLDVYYFSNNIFYEVDKDFLNDSEKLNQLSKLIDNTQEILKDFNLNDFVKSINNGDIEPKDAISILPSELFKDKGIITMIVFDINKEFQDDFLDNLPKEQQEYSRSIIEEFNLDI